MRWFVTGATGFVGGRLARRLRERGDDVACLVRSPDRAAALGALRCALVEGDLLRIDPAQLDGADVVVHAAGVYELGVTDQEAAAMRDVNVGGTERVLDAVAAAGTGRAVYVSTMNVFGDTGGAVVDETYERDVSRGFLSAYDETKYRAHELVAERAAAGAPVVTVMPGSVYGPGDTSQLGEEIRGAMTGRLRYVSFPDLGVNAVHVDDVVAGIVLAAEQGAPGRAYALGGERTRMVGLIRAAAAAAGRKPPRLTMPGLAVKAMAPLAPLAGPLLGLPRNLREMIRASDGVTYWGSDERARAELGYAPRDLATGMRDTAREASA